MCWCDSVTYEILYIGISDRRKSGYSPNWHRIDNFALINVGEHIFLFRSGLECVELVSRIGATFITLGKKFDNYSFPIVLSESCWIGIINRKVALIERSWKFNLNLKLINNSENDRETFLRNRPFFPSRKSIRLPGDIIHYIKLTCVKSEKKTEFFLIYLKF